MRKIIAVILASFLLSRVLHAAPAGEPVMPKGGEKKYSAGDKLGRGCVNMITLPADFLYKFHRAASKDSDLKLILRLLGGFGNALLRFGAGAVDLFTFPFDFPDSRKAPLIEPEYFWQQ